MENLFRGLMERQDLDKVSSSAIPNSVDFPNSLSQRLYPYPLSTINYVD